MASSSRLCLAARKHSQTSAFGPVREITHCTMFHSSFWGWYAQRRRTFRLERNPDLIRCAMLLDEQISGILAVTLELTCSRLCCGYHPRRTRLCNLVHHYITIDRAILCEHIFRPLVALGIT